MDSSMLNKKIELPVLSDRTKRLIRDVMFLSAFAMMTAGGILANSMFTFGSTARYYLHFAARLMIYAKLILFDRKNKAAWLIFLPAMILGKTLYSRFGYDSAFTLAVTAAGALGVKFSKAAKVYFYTALACLSAVIVSSQTGLITDLCYESTSPFAGFHLRHAMGIIYPTDFACYILLLLLAFFAAYHKYDKGYYLRALPVFAVTAVIYCLCITRLDCICMLLLGVGLIAVRELDRHNERSPGKAGSALKTVFEQLCIWSMPILAVFFNILTLAYSSSSPLLVKLDNIISGRLMLGRQGFDRFNVPIFGQFIYMSGLGGSLDTLKLEDYFFLDSSYVSCLLRMGLIYTLLMIAAFVVIGFKYRGDHVILLCSALIALNCMIAHHLPDISYNFMITAVAAEGGVPLKELFSRKAEKGREVPENSP